MQASGNSIAIGHADQFAYYAGRRAPATWPHRVGALPSAAHCLRHRSVPATTARCRILVGTAGVGKTQLAAHEARTAWAGGQLDLLVWVTATSRAAVLAAYTQAFADITGSEPGDPEQGAREFLTWLRPVGAGRPVRWLIALDDLRDPDDLRGLWPPDRPDGRTLVTTWRRDVAREGPGREVTTVPPFTSAEAHGYLTAVLAAAGRAEPPEQLEALARELGHLPLALSQAAAHLVGADLPCADYLGLLGDGTHGLADLVPDAAWLPDAQSLPVQYAWDAALERADAHAPVGTARVLLELTAPLAADGIPAAALTAAQHYLDGHRTARPPQDAGQADGGDGPAATLALLHRWSLVDYHPDDPDRSVRVHPVLQRVTRENAPAARSGQLAESAAGLLLAASGQPQQTTDFLGRVRPAQPRRPQPPAFSANVLRVNVEALIRQDRRLMLGAGESEHRDGWGPGSGLHPLVLRVGDVLTESGRPEAAATYFAALLPDAAERLGPQHESTIGLRSRLADLTGETSGPAGAAVGFRSLIDDRLTLLRPEVRLAPHERAALVREVSKLRCRLAYWLQQAGDPAGVHTVYRDLISDDAFLRAVAGRLDPRDFHLLGSAAVWRARAGDAAGAAAELRSLVSEVLSAYGPASSAAFDIRFDLAWWLGEAGDAKGAVKVLADLFDAQLKGRWFETNSDNPYAMPGRLATFRTHAALAHWRGQAGDPAGAAAALRDLADEQLRILGPDHPDLATTRRNLAFWQERSRSRRRPRRG
ncbi:NB-ARC domain-containing protein [Kitasatospora sp. NPDC058218]|uniref:NB-ARC domain-containing protein n=1 Tax=Kitasatospora sp. NPDC058218 TaxID=3346385 RepID=UPI0036DBD366